MTEVAERNPVALVVAQPPVERKRTDVLNAIAASIGRLEEHRLAEATVRYEWQLAGLVADDAYRKITAAEGIPRARARMGRR